MQPVAVGYVDTMLEQDKEIVLNTGTYVELIRRAYLDYARLVKAKVAKFSSLGSRAGAAWAGRVWRECVECAASYARHSSFFGEGFGIYGIVT